MLNFGKSPGDGRRAADRLGQLGDRLDRLRPVAGRRFTALSVLLVAFLGLNLAWLFGIVKPRVDALENELQRTRASERDAFGQLALASMQVEHLGQVFEYSARYRIPADLARSIHSIALSEDLDPDLAFRLVETESSFRRNAVSEAGAIGYTQLLPSTARWLDPRVGEEDLFDQTTNLRLGFRYLRLLLEDVGDVRLALLAYNRGPGTVRSIVARGEDPANGYATRIMGSE